MIFDTVGKSSFSSNIRSLKDKGFLILAAAGLPEMVRGLWSSITSSKQAISGVMSEKAEELIFLKESIEAGKLKSVIDAS